MKKYFLFFFSLGFLIFFGSHSFATDRSTDTFSSKVKFTSESSYADSKNISIGNTLRFQNLPYFLGDISGNIFLSNSDFTCSGTGDEAVCVTEVFTGEKRITNTLTNNGRTLTGYTTVNSGNVPVRLKIYKGFQNTYDVFIYGNPSTNLNKSEIFSTTGINLGTNSSSRQIYMEAIVEAGSRTCTPLNASSNGTQTWDIERNSWGTCTGFTCADGYSPNGGVCSPNPTCGEANGDEYFQTAEEISYSDGTIKYQISNSNGEIPQTRQDLIFTLMENFGVTGSWQKYDASDDSEPNNTGKDDQKTDADPVNTKYFVYGDKPRYALTTIKNAENNFIITIQANRWD
ncbi:MAG: hypothetical protein KU38_04950 [Sulfurovum sp. FS08-3]|nr:MAG: hypothetical protein KU38_04950 [Sulfurovum sp. FS08-3]